MSDDKERDLLAARMLLAMFDAIGDILGVCPFVFDVGDFNHRCSLEAGHAGHHLTACDEHGEMMVSPDGKDIIAL